MRVYAPKGRAACTVFDLTYDGTQCIVRNVGSRWEMSHNGEITRLGMGSLRWTEFLWRAIEAIEAH